MAQVKLIKDYPNYYIYDDGRVQSVAQLKPKFLKHQPATQTKGYRQVRLFNKDVFPSSGQLHYVHRLVYTHFIGDIPKDMTVDHIDNDSFNNDVTNLQLLSLKKNHQKYLQNTLGESMRGNRDKLLEDYNELKTYKKVADKWGISPSMAWRIIKNFVQYKDTDGKYKFRPYDNGTD